MSFRQIKATKTNLIKLEKKKGFATKGEKFLEFKREQLISEIKGSSQKYWKQKEQFTALFRTVLILLHQTYKEMGKRDLVLISDMSKIQYKPQIDMQYFKKFGIITPEILFEFNYDKTLPAYNFNNSSHFLDDLVRKLREMFQALINTAVNEDILIKLTHNFKRIDRRINALKNVIIPKLESDIKNIKTKLEEIERENFVRLKKTKDLLEKKKIANI